MPINLLKLPRLVGLLVVTELEEYSEIFLISICSRRTYSLVKNARITAPPKLVFVFREFRGHKKIDIEVLDEIQGWFHVTSLIHVHELASDDILTVKLSHDYKADTNIDLWCEGVGLFCHRFECANEPLAVQKAFQDHINSIFHYSDAYELHLKCEGILPNITNVKDIVILRDTVDVPALTDVLATYPDHRSIFIRSKTVEKLPADSPFFQIQHVLVRSHCGPDYFQNFVGRNMWLQFVTLTDQDIIQFLHKWMSNESYHNLESLTIVLENTLSINVGVIRQSIEFEEYDSNEPEKRPAEYVHDVPIRQHFSLSYPLRNQEFVEVKRITDGKRAFLRIQPFAFQFFVHKD
ncbi:unnamed protein product [Caenorhabditis nigoni]